jgi:two-component system, OmpR family, phosphate regulon response regulator PhoB
MILDGGRSLRQLAGETVTDRQILVVEDEWAIREMIAFGLRRAGYSVHEASDGNAARAMIADHRPDLVLIDWMLPDSSGLELTRSIKRNADTRELPIIMVTARSDEADKVAGLEGGADDYVTKPFSPRELHARIAALLRRSDRSALDGELRVGHLVMDCAAHRVVAGTAAVELGPTEYRLLEFFMRNPERVFSRTHLLDSVWGGNVYIAERTVDVHIRRLRKSLEAGAAADFVQTVRGTGYRISTKPMA